MTDSNIQVCKLLNVFSKKKNIFTKKISYHLIMLCRREETLTDTLSELMCE